MFALVGFGLGLPEIAVVFLVVLLVFGPAKLPQLGEGVGKMLRGFKKEMKTLDDESKASAVEPAYPGVRSEIDVTPQNELDREKREA